MRACAPARTLMNAGTRHNKWTVDFTVCERRPSPFSSWSSTLRSIFLGCSSCGMLTRILPRIRMWFSRRTANVYVREREDNMKNDKIKGPYNASSSTRRHSSCLCTDATPSVVPMPTHLLLLLLSVVERGRRRGIGQRHRKHQWQRLSVQLHVECVIHFLAKLFTKENAYKT